MKLLVSTAKWVFHVDTETHDVSVVKGNCPEYYGISWTYDGRQLCLSHSGLDNAYMKTVNDYYNSEVGGISLGDETRFDCLSLTHQILCTPEHIVATNTGRNCLTVFRQEDLYYFHHWMDHARWDHTVDGDVHGSHFNSVYLLKDRLYVLAHSGSVGLNSYVLELAWPSLETIRRIETPARQSHNIWPWPTGEMVICDSKNGTLVEVQSGDVLWKSQMTKALCRGLASHAHLVFVGKSSTIGNRRGRVLADGGVWVVDRRRWEQVDYIPLPRSGCVHEVRILDAEDVCHHGRPAAFPLNPEPQAVETYQELARGLSATTADWFIANGLRWTVRDDLVSEGMLSVRDGGDICIEEGFLTVALQDALHMRDVRVSAEMQVTGDQDHRHAGLVARYAGPGDQNMLLGMLHYGNGIARADIWRNLDGEWSLLVHQTVKEPTGRVEFVADGSSLILSVNGQKILRTTDEALKGPGKVGIRGICGLFRNFRAEALR